MKFSLLCLFFLSFFSFAILPSYGDTKSSNDDKTLSSYVGNSIPEDVVTALKENANALNPVSLVWRRTRLSALDFKTLVVKTKCIYDYGFLNPINAVFMWQDNKIYLYYTQKSILRDNAKNLPYAYDVHKKNIELFESVSERSFDGKFYFNGSGNETNDQNSATLGVFPFDKMKDRKYPDVIYQEYTHLIGFKFPNTGQEIGQIQQSYPIYLTEKSSSIEFQHNSKDHTNEDCMLIKMQSRDIWSNTERIFCFWVSRKLNSAITQLKIHYLDGKLVQEVKNTDFFLLPGKQIYLPKKNGSAQLYLLYNSERHFANAHFY